MKLFHLALVLILASLVVCSCSAGKTNNTHSNELKSKFNDCTNELSNLETKLEEKEDEARRIRKELISVKREMKNRIDLFSVPIADDNKDSLKSIDKFKVIIESVDKEASDNGLKTDEVKVKAELLLRTSGITVDDSSNAYIYININPIKVNTYQWAYSVSVDVKQPAYILRDSMSEYYGISSWNCEYIGKSNDLNEHPIELVTTCIENLANDYLSVND